MTINLNDLPEEIKQKGIALQNLRRSFTIMNTEKYRIDESLSDTESAIKELEECAPETNVYKSIGGIMVNVEKDKILAEKKSMKTTLEMRSKTLSQKLERLKNQLETAEKSFQTDLQNFKV